MNTNDLKPLKIPESEEAKRRDTPTADTPEWEPYLYLVNEREKRLKGVTDFHHKAWAEEAILNEILAQSRKQAQEEILQKVVDELNNWNEPHLKPEDIIYIAHTLGIELK